MNEDDAWQVSRCPALHRGQRSEVIRTYERSQRALSKELDVSRTGKDALPDHHRGIGQQATVKYGK